MNDTRFKELLNLHLDHRLSGEDARELEHALNADPERRRMFQRYVLVERGCAELFRRSASDAPAPDTLVRALRDAEARMQARDARREWVVGWRTWGATAGAAALVALMIARVSQPGVAVVAVVDEPYEAVEPSQEIVVTQTGTTLGLAVQPTMARTALPPHLTLDALGISQVVENRPSLASSWTGGDADVSTRLADAQALGDQWMRHTSAEWEAMAISAAAFNARPINAWSGQTAGAQMQAASFTFER